MQKKIVKTIVVIIVVMIGMITSMEYKGKIYAESDIAEQKNIFIGGVNYEEKDNKHSDINSCNSGNGNVNNSV